MVFHADLCNFQYIVDVLNVSLDLCPVLVLRSGDLLSGQRRGQCSHHSASGCGDNMVQRGGMLFVGLDFVKFLDPAVNAIINGFVEPFNHGSPGRTFFPDNFDPRGVNKITNGPSLIIIF